jgi:hypothetical protein
MKKARIKREIESDGVFNEGSVVRMSFRGDMQNIAGAKKLLVGYRGQVRRR